MLIPSIDVMGGRIVQLVQGERKALESDDFEYWIRRFGLYPMVQLIDLDAAMGKGDNGNLIAMICRRLPCQIGGGIRNIGRAQELLDLGARRVILGSSLIKAGAIDAEFAEQCAGSIGAERLTFAIDSRNGKVSIKGWREGTNIDPLAMVRLLDPYCGAFLYTHIDTEGTMTGFPVEMAERLRKSTTRQTIVAGGIRSMDEVKELDAMRVDAVVGMAIYTDAIKA